MIDTEKEETPAKIAKIGHVNYFLLENRGTDCFLNSAVNAIHSMKEVVASLLVLNQDQLIFNTKLKCLTEMFKKKLSDVKGVAELNNLMIINPMTQEKY